MKNDGGAAFPTVMTEFNRDSCEREVTSVGGMSLRDYFATHAPSDVTDLGKATVSFCTSQLGMSVDKYGNNAFENYCRLISKRRYAYADAMIAEREK